MSSAASFIGRTFGGRFTITDFIAEGGMGAVYRGVGGDAGDVAIKVMAPELAQDGDFVRRFMREAKTAERLKHRSTVRIFEHGVEDGIPYIVMELVRGAELVQLLAHEGRFPEARAVRIIAQVCSALAAAHDLGIVHRDLKPENVMIMRDPADPTLERVKVLDFGIAKIVSPELASADALPVSSTDRVPSSNAPELTKMGTLLGTPDYMAPEQFRGSVVDGRTDLYACGLILHQLITGKVPLLGDTWLATSMLRNESTGPRPSDLVPDTHEGLDDLVASMLSLDPDGRPRGARQLQERLLALLPELANVLLPIGKPRRRGAATTRGAAETAGPAFGATLPSPGVSREATTSPVEGATRPVDLVVVRPAEAVAAPPRSATSDPVPAAAASPIAVDVAAVTRPVAAEPAPSSAGDDAAPSTDGRSLGGEPPEFVDGHAWLQPGAAAGAAPPVAPRSRTALLVGLAVALLAVALVVALLGSGR